MTDQFIKEALRELSNRVLDIDRQENGNVVLSIANDANHYINIRSFMLTISVAEDKTTKYKGVHSYTIGKKDGDLLFDFLLAGKKIVPLHKDYKPERRRRNRLF